MWLCLLFSLSFTPLSALDVLVTQAQSHQSQLLIHDEPSTPPLLLSLLNDNFTLSGKIHLQKQQEILSSWQEYRKHGYDYILWLHTDEQKQEITAKMRSPWQSKGTPQNPTELALFEKTFHYKNEAELRQIAHQLSDEVMEKMLGEKGFASYPIAYVVSEQGHYRLCVSDLYHENEKILYESSDPIAGLSWSPDARSIAFVQLGDKAAFLKVVQCHSQRVQRVAQHPYLASPVYSSDQKYLYFIGMSGRVPQIFQHNLLTAEQKIMTTDSAWILDLQPGSDPYHLLVSSERSGNYQIYEFNILSNTYKRLTFHNQPCISGVLNVPRQSLFFCELADKKSLMIERSFIESRSRYVTLIGEAEEMNFAPYPELIVYEQSYQGIDNIVIKSLRTGQEHVWETPQGQRISKPCWAPQPGEF